jgi:hypothetical protein
VGDGRFNDSYFEMQQVAELGNFIHCTQLQTGCNCLSVYGLGTSISVAVLQIFEFSEFQRTSERTEQVSPLY